MLLLLLLLLLLSLLLLVPLLMLLLCTAGGRPGRWRAWRAAAFARCAVAFATHPSKALAFD